MLKILATCLILTLLIIVDVHHAVGYSKSELVRDSALDVLESLTKIAELGFVIRDEETRFYGVHNGSSAEETSPQLGPIPLNGRQRECTESERQVTTVDKNSAQVCCVGPSTTCKRLQCTKVVDHCCLRMDDGAWDTLCTGVVGAQRASLPASC